MSVIDSVDVEAFDVDQFLADIESVEQQDPNAEVLRVLRGAGDVWTFKENLSRELKVIESSLVANFLENSDALLSLYRETENCECILSSMERTLSGFGDSLRGVSDDIRQLQHKSEDLSLQLKSRSETQEKLITFMDSVIVSPDLVKVICEEEDCGSEKFQSAIDQLQKKLRAHADLPSDLPSVLESGPELEKLKVKAISRVREFLASKVNALKQPRTNIQILQRNVLVNLRGLSKFLKQVDNGIYFNEIWNLYAATLSRQYSNQFKIYVQTLTKLQVEATASKSDLIGGTTAEVSPNSHQGNVFSIKGRERVIREDLEAEAIALVMTEAGAGGGINKCYPETLLRSHQKLLVDTACSEYLFLIDFFDLLMNKSDQQKMFDAVMGKTLQWFSDHISSAVIKESFDPVGLLLSLRILEFNRDLMLNKRKIPVLDTYFESLLTQVRHRLGFTIDLNTESLKKIDLRKLNPVANAPFYVSRRFAEFSAAILFVKSELLEEDDILLTESVDGLSTSYEAFLMALSKRVEDQQIFLLNNVDLVLSVFKERQLAPILPLVRRYEEKMNSIMSVFIEKNLLDRFGPLIKTTVEQEKHLQAPTISLQDCERLVVHFQQTWKSEIGKIQQEFFNGIFSNFQTASEILRNALTQLLLYYTRFQKIVQTRLLSSAPAPAPAWARQIVPSAVIMAEIKQTTSSYI